ncbi:MAG: sigma-70 family RNA polymerase sigma factor [Planctomycetota bacterium]
MSPAQLCQIWDAFQPRLLLIARSMAGSSELESHAEDAVQEAFIELARTQNPPNDVEGWLVQVTRRRMIDFRRREQSQKRRDHLHGTRAQARDSWFESDAHTSIEERELHVQLTSELRKLPDQNRQIIVLAHWGNQSFAQIAKLTESSKSTVHRRYAESIERLREAVGCIEDCRPTNVSNR